MIHWDRYIAIIGRITQRPEVWRQGRSGAVKPLGHVCESAYCVFGHAHVEMGKRLLQGSSYEVYASGVDYFGFSCEEGDYVWSGMRTLAELQELAITQKFPWERT